MEEDPFHNSLQITPLLFNVNTNHVHQLAQVDLNQNNVMLSAADGIHHFPLPLPPWDDSLQTAHNYVEFVAEGGVSGIQQELSYTNSEFVSGLTAMNYSLNMDAQKKQEPQENYCRVSQPKSSETVAASSVPKKQRNVSKQRIADRRRRLRITQGLNQLQELLPESRKGSKASLWDNIIDYIKYLQLEIKDLSQSRLGGESTSSPSIFLEGYGHYLVHDQMQIQPLEEMMGKLLEVNPSAATQLLESRGLVTMPLALAEEFS